MDILVKDGKMKKAISLLICISILIISSPQNTTGQTGKLQVRIKDIVSLDGIYEAKLLGMGVVTGLNNTGDKQNNEVTQRFLENIHVRLQEYGRYNRKLFQ